MTCTRNIPPATPTATTAEPPSAADKPLAINDGYIDMRLK